MATASFGGTSLANAQNGPIWGTAAPYPAGGGQGGMNNLGYDNRVGGGGQPAQPLPDPRDENGYKKYANPNEPMIFTMNIGGKHQLADANFWGGGPANYLQPDGSITRNDGAVVRGPQADTGYRGDPYNWTPTTGAPPASGGAGGQGGSYGGGQGGMGGLEGGGWRIPQGGGQGGGSYSGSVGHGYPNGYPMGGQGGIGDLGRTGGNMWQGGGQPGQGGSGGGAAFGGTAPGGGQGGMGGQSGHGGAPGFTGGNPYLPQMADAITQQTTQAFNRNVLPNIGSNAMAAGGYGGSRQGVIEANAMNDMGQNLTNGLAGLYGNAYNTGLQYDLGLRNNNLGFANLDRNIANDNNNWQMAGANFGLGIYDRQQRDNQMGINAGTNMQNTPQGYWNNFSQGANSLGQGYGTSSSTQNMPGSPMTGILGGAQLGAGVGKWWGDRSTANSPGGANGSGWGTGSGYGNNDFGDYL